MAPEPEIEVARIAGDAPTLVFLHEGLGSRSSWREFPAELARATGKAALVYSRAGYGRSSPRPLPWPLDFMEREARDALPTLLADEKVDDAILVGHSDGASIALVYAGELGHGVRALVLEAPHVFVEDETVASIARLDDELRVRLGRHHAHADALFAAWRGVWLHPDFRRWNIEACLPGVRVPALVIQGADDQYGTVAQVEAIRRGVAGPVETLLLPACGHAPHRDQPARTLAAMADFIARVSF
jgi:pimeloyl-ACP methyl ester carboxylesterase